MRALLQSYAESQPRASLPAAESANRRDGLATVRYVAVAVAKFIRPFQLCRHHFIYGVLQSVGIKNQGETLAFVGDSLNKNQMLTHPHNNGVILTRFCKQGY